MDNENKKLIDELLGKTNYNVGVYYTEPKECDCDDACDCACTSETKTSDEEITIKLSMDAHEAVGTIEELKEKLEELPDSGKVIVFNNCAFQFGKHAMNTNYHKPVDNSRNECDYCDA